MMDGTQPKKKDAYFCHLKDVSQIFKDINKAAQTLISIRSIHADDGNILDGWEFENHYQFFDFVMRIFGLDEIAKNGGKVVCADS